MAGKWERIYVLSLVINFFNLAKEEASNCLLKIYNRGGGKMSDKFARIYSHSFDISDLENIMDEFGHQKLSLSNPANKQIILLSDIGEHFPSSMNEIVDKIKNRHTFNFLWWRDEIENMISRIRFMDDKNVAEDYYLDGFEIGADIKEIVTILTNRFKKRVIDRKSFGLVIDILGRTIEYDWDRFFTTSNKELDEADKTLWTSRLTVLGLTIQKVDQIKLDMSKFDRELIGNTVIFQSLSS